MLAQIKIEMDAVLNSVNTNAKVKETTEKLMNEVNNSNFGHCFHPLLSLGDTNLHYKF